MSKADDSICADEEELEIDASHFPTDRYKALSEIGHGAAGNVYLCRDRLLGTQVAVKCLRHISGEQLIAFQLEAKATNSLSHQNIVKIFNFGVTDSGAPYMVMEYIEGISLEQFIGQFGPLSAEDALELAEVLADALSYAHSKRIFHRDIKSSNILIANYSDESDVARATIEPRSIHLIDFGVAMIKHANQEPTIVQGHTVVGTPAYMPPDQAQGKTYDERSEIYALGCALFEALVGSPPFAGETALEIIGKHASEIPPRVSSLIDLEQPQAIDELVAKCLAKEQSERFRTMQEFREQCRAILNQMNVQRDSDTGDDTTGGSERGSNIAALATYSQTNNRNETYLKKNGAKIAIAVAAVAALGCLAPVIQWATAPSAFVSHHSQISVPPISLTKKTFDNAQEERAKVVRKLIANGKASAFVNMDEYLSAYSWNDVDLIPFIKCKTINSLDLSNNPGITEKGMRYLDDVPLHQLNLTNTNVHDLSQLPHCEETLNTLKLGQNKSSHRSLQSLVRFKKLGRLVFADSQVTPDDLRLLAERLPLSDITVYNCSLVKKADVDAIQKEHPYLSFNTEGVISLSLLERDGERSNKLKEEKRYAESLRLWQEWERKAPQFKDHHKRILGRSLALQADCYKFLHNRAKADETMAHALAVVKQFGDRSEKLLIFDSAFSHYCGTKQEDKAIEVGLESQTLQKEGPKGQNERQEAMLAHLLTKKGRYKEAQQFLISSNTALRKVLSDVQSLDTVPNQTAERNLFIDNLTSLAVCYEKMGEPSKSRECLAEREKQMRAAQILKQSGAPQALPPNVTKPNKPAYGLLNE